MKIGALDEMYKPASRAIFGALLVLIIPLLAMQITDEVVWDLADFIVAGGLLFGASFVFQLLARKSSSTLYRVAIGIAIVALLILVFANLAVGLIGSEDNLANLMYVAVIAIGIIGAISIRFQARGMIIVLVAMACAQFTIATIALILRLGAPYTQPIEILYTNGLFVLLFIGSALLFWLAAQKNPEIDLP